VGMLGRLVVGAHGRGDHPGPETVEPKVLAEVFERVAGPVAESETRGAWLRGWRLLAIDGFDGAADLAAAFTAAFATLAPATRARHLAALRSALGWWRARGWLVGDPTAGWARPKIARDHSRALTREQIAALWRLDVGIREKTLWRLLYETAARASEILTLDIGDLDRPGKRARMVSKGGDTDWVYYQTGTALLLPRLLTGRTRGPVFLAERAPPEPHPPWTCAPTPAGPDCPTAGLPNCSNTPLGARDKLGEVTQAVFVDQQVWAKPGYQRRREPTACRPLPPPICPALQLGALFVLEPVLRHRNDL